jgi:hypothetical protein
VNLVLMGASPIDHPKGVLIVKLLRRAVTPSHSCQLGASPSAPTNCEPRTVLRSAAPPDRLGSTMPCRRRPTAESVV